MPVYLMVGTYDKLATVDDVQLLYSHLIIKS